MIASTESHLRVVIVNYNGGALLKRCVASALDADWPGSRHVVIIDNGSTDASLAPFRSQPDIHLIETGTNGGFSAANIGFGRQEGLPDADYFLLLNPDAEIDTGALRPLAEALEGDVGVAAPLIVFDQEFVDVPIEARSVVREVSIDGIDVTSRCLSPFGIRLPGQETALWLFDEPAVLSVPIPDEAHNGDITFHVAATASRSKGGRNVIPVDSLPRSKRVQNAGGRLDARWFGINEHFGRDLTEVAAIESSDSRKTEQWCGAAALLSAAYVQDTGGFDHRFFLYYEDTDLSLLGTRNGWSYAFVPSAIVKHRHSASTRQGTKLVETLQHRNRLLMMARHAPVSRTAVASLRAFVTPISMLIRSLRVGPSAGQALRRMAWWRTKSVVAAMPMMPGALQSRRSMQESRTI